MAQRIRIFIDYWNFHLGMADWNKDYRVNFEKLSEVLVREASQIVKDNGSFQGVSVYTSIDPNTEAGRKDKDFFNNVLQNKSGYTIQIKERKPRSKLHCQNCDTYVTDCPNCKQPLRKTVEKGVDTGIVTEMMQGAWDGTYDVAVLLSNDEDLIPAVSYLGTRDKKIIHASFGGAGRNISQKCWDRIKLDSFAEEMKL